MAGLTKILSITTLTTTLSLELFIIPGLSIPKPDNRLQINPDSTLNSDWIISQTFQPPDRGAPLITGAGGSRFQPPDRGAPSITEGAATRSTSSCIASNQKKITPLLPQNNFGLTLSERPTFFGYIPQSSAKNAEFILMDENNKLAVRKNFPIPKEAGIVSINLPADKPALEVGKKYKWRLRIVCNPDDRSQDATTNLAWIQRVQPNNSLADQIKNATPENLSSVYADAGIWHEAFASIAKLHGEQPNDPKVAANWQEMLKSVGLQDFVQESVVGEI